MARNASTPRNGKSRRVHPLRVADRAQRPGASAPPADLRPEVHRTGGRRLVKSAPSPPTRRFDEYPFELRPLTPEEGAGYLITLPDLPGCMSDGATPEQAVANARDAFSGWIAAYRAEGWEVPRPFATTSLSGRFVQRVPRSVHGQLVLTAQRQGVSVNSLVLTLIARGLGTHPSGLEARGSGPPPRRAGSPSR